MNDNSTNSNQGDQYANIALNTTGLIVENVLCHPLIVLRRQCQVGGGDGVTLKTHLTPFSLIPVAIHLYQWQGLSAFYKGLSSTLTVKGLQLAAEDATTKFTPWPKVSFYSYQSEINIEEKFRINHRFFHTYNFLFLLEGTEQYKWNLLC